MGELGAVTTDTAMVTVMITLRVFRKKTEVLSPSIYS